MSQEQMKLLEREIHAALVREYALEVERDIGALTYEDLLLLMGRAADRALGRRIVGPKPPKNPWKDNTKVIETFQCTNGDWDLHDSLFQTLRMTFPAVDALQVVREAKLFTTTDRKYTKQGMPMYLRNWFKKAQQDVERKAAWQRNNPSAQARPQQRDTRDQALAEEQRRAREATRGPAKASSVIDSLLRRK